MAIDAIFNHPNVGPYLAKELIHSLVASNPSPAYVERVAGFFNDNGSGQRGSVWAMVKAILLDPEARNSPADPTYGKLKEPVVYIAQHPARLRRHVVQRHPESTDTSRYARDMGQRSPADDRLLLLPAGLQRAAGVGGLLGPEFGILDASTSLKRANFVNQILFTEACRSAADVVQAPNGTSINLTELHSCPPIPSISSTGSTA